MKRSLLTLVLFASGVSACATTPSGIRDPDLFTQVAEQTRVVSIRSATDVARCFEDRAALLPMTTFRPSTEESVVIYRLRGFGYTFEEIRFEPMTEGGSSATVSLAPNLNAKWHRDFQKDRLSPLQACASGEAE